MPEKNEKNKIKHSLLKGNSLTILDGIKVHINLANLEMPYEAEIPCLDEKKASINESIVTNYQGLLDDGLWGAAKLIYDPEANGGIRIIEFKPMQVGEISLEVLMDLRKSYTVDEWIDLLIRTVGYEPSKYSLQEKIWMLCRLIPVVQNRINMMELGPPGSGKSFLYNNISRYVWVSAAPLSPAVLFYNQKTKRPGLLTRYDLLVLDEAQSIKFKDEGEIQAQFKGYLEQGVYTRGDIMATAECGLMLLANIELLKDDNNFYSNGNKLFIPRRKDFIRKLPTLFHESPLIDRFHGILPGWKIPPFNTEQIAQGYGLKADFFSQVCHKLRKSSLFTQKVSSKLALSGYKRDCTAVERLAAGLSKILLLDPDEAEFKDYILKPAMEMRELVRKQLHQLDPNGFERKLDISSIGNKKVTSSFIFEMEGKYGVIEEIGVGGSAKVYKAFDREREQLVAVKVLINESDVIAAKSLQREIDVYQKLVNIENENIIKVSDVFKYKNAYAIVMEYAREGSLWDLMGGYLDKGIRSKLSLDNVKTISCEIINGLMVLHKEGIVHRDIKPQNILQINEKWKIADFGISKRVDKPVTLHTFKGAYSFPWAPPEQILGLEAKTGNDIYSLGKVISFMITGKEEPIKDEFPEQWCELLLNCLDEKLANRPDIEELYNRVDKIEI